MDEKSLAKQMMTTSMGKLIFGLFLALISVGFLFFTNDAPKQSPIPGDQAAGENNE